jgi:hypothetical protein
LPSSTPKHFWREIKNQRWLFEEIGQKLNVKSKDDWNQVDLQNLLRYNGVIRVLCAKIPRFKSFGEKLNDTLGTIIRGVLLPVCLHCIPTTILNTLAFVRPTY